MIRATLVVAALLLVQHSSGQKGETPPYDPAPANDKMSPYTNQELAFTVFYPKEFVMKTAQDLRTVMERGHREVHGDNPSSDPEHLEAARCMHTLFYATSEAAPKSGTTPNSEDNFPDTILVEDIDPNCVQKKQKGDKALSNLVATVLDVPNATHFGDQIWFVAGGNRRIHSGMSGTTLTLARSSGKTDPSSPSPSVALFVMAAAVEQKGHRILIVFLSGTTGEKHENVPHMSIAFEDGRPVILFPFLLGNINLIK